MGTMSNKEMEGSTITFYRSAIILIQEIAPFLEKHLSFREVIGRFQPIEISDLTTEFEKKMAMSIILYERDQQNVVISDIDVLHRVNMMLMDAISNACSTMNIDFEESISYLLDGYPIILLSEICHARKYHAYIIAESVKRLITIRMKYSFPKELYNVIDGLVPLVGDEKSPLTAKELEALYRYLGSRKNIYVHILLNCLFELSRSCANFSGLIIKDNLIDAIKSSWLFLLLWTSSYFPKTPPIDNYDADIESEIYLDAIPE